MDRRGSLARPYPRAPERALLALATVLTTGAVAPDVDADADESRRVLVGGACLPPGVDPEPLLGHLGAEMAPRRVRLLEPSALPVFPGDVVLLLEECRAAPPSVRVVVWHGTERRERALDLSDVPGQDRARTLALALAETSADPTLSRPAGPAPVPWMLAPSPSAAGTAPAAPAASPVEAVPPEPPVAHEPSPPIDPRGAAPRDEWRMRASAGVRFAPRTETLAGGVTGGVAWSRFGAGASLFGARTEVPLGDVTLWVPAATAFHDVVRFGGGYGVRLSAELGAAIATGTPVDGAAGTTEAGLHAALHAGPRALWSVSEATDLEASATAGYASSLRARDDEAYVIGLDGWLVTLEAGLGFR